MAGGGRTYVVIHCCGTVEEDAGVVGPFVAVDGAAVVAVVGAVVDVVAITEEATLQHPLPRFLCPIRIRLIPRI